MATKESMLEMMEANAKENGYFICPNKELLDDLITGLVANDERYGYGSCPCRLSSGIKGNDVDVICPCEYRDADVEEFGSCYCGLFVSKDVSDDPSKLGSIPERRPPEVIDAAMEAMEKKGSEKASEEVPTSTAGQVPVWRCKVCGYLAAREHPPPVCPICKAKKERFEPFEFG